MTLQELQVLPKGTRTNYGDFAGLEDREIEGETKPVATFDNPRYGPEGKKITATPFLASIRLDKAKPK
jgi:hypothetical protein